MFSLPLISTRLYVEDFSTVLVMGDSLKYHDNAGFTCTHELESHDHDHHHRAVHHEGHHEGHHVGMEADELGFSAYYVDTLLADGTAPLHSPASDGAEVGVTIGVVSDEADPSYAFTQNVFEIKASGIDGLVAVCTMPLTLDAPTALSAAARVYVAQAGWHEVADEVRVWAEVSGKGAFTLLPGCTPAATRTNIDAIGLRRGSGVSGVDPAARADDWQFQTLSTRLGLVPTGATVRVCASLQSGAGSE